MPGYGETPAPEPMLTIVPDPLFLKAVSAAFERAVVAVDIQCDDGVDHLIRRVGERIERGYACIVDQKRQSFLALDAGDYMKKCLPSEKGRLRAPRL